MRKKCVTVEGIVDDVRTMMAELNNKIEDKLLVEKSQLANMDEIKEAFPQLLETKKSSDNNDEERMYSENSPTHLEVPKKNEGSLSPSEWDQQIARVINAIRDTYETEQDIADADRNSNKKFSLSSNRKSKRGSRRRLMPKDYLNDREESSLRGYYGDSLESTDSTSGGRCHPNASPRHTTLNTAKSRQDVISDQEWIDFQHRRMATKEQVLDRSIYDSIPRKAASEINCTFNSAIFKDNREANESFIHNHDNNPVSKHSQSHNFSRRRSDSDIKAYPSTGKAYTLHRLKDDQNTNFSFEEPSFRSPSQVEGLKSDIEDNYLGESTPGFEKKNSRTQVYKISNSEDCKVNHEHQGSQIIYSPKLKPFAQIINKNDNNIDVFDTEKSLSQSVSDTLYGVKNVAKSHHCHQGDKCSHSISSNIQDDGAEKIHVDKHEKTHLFTGNFLETSSTGGTLGKTFLVQMDHNVPCISNKTGNCLSDESEKKIYSEKGLSQSELNLVDERNLTQEKRDEQNFGLYRPVQLLERKNPPLYNIGTRVRKSSANSNNQSYKRHSSTMSLRPSLHRQDSYHDCDNRSSDKDFDKKHPSTNIGSIPTINDSVAALILPKNSPPTSSRSSPLTGKRRGSSPAVVLGKDSVFSCENGLISRSGIRNSLSCNDGFYTVIKSNEQLSSPNYKSSSVENILLDDIKASSAPPQERRFVSSKGEKDNQSNHVTYRGKEYQNKTNMIYVNSEDDGHHSSVQNFTLLERVSTPTYETRSSIYQSCHHRNQGIKYADSSESEDCSKDLSEEECSIMDLTTNKVSSYKNICQSSQEQLSSPKGTVEEKVFEGKSHLNVSESENNNSLTQSSNVDGNLLENIPMLGSSEDTLVKKRKIIRERYRLVLEKGKRLLRKDDIDLKKNNANLTKQLERKIFENDNLKDTASINEGSNRTRKCGKSTRKTSTSSIAEKNTEKNKLRKISIKSNAKKGSLLSLDNISECSKTDVSLIHKKKLKERLPRVFRRRSSHNSFDKIELEKTSLKPNILKEDYQRGRRNSQNSYSEDSESSKSTFDNFNNSNKQHNQYHGSLHETAGRKDKTGYESSLESLTWSNEQRYSNEEQSCDEALATVDDELSHSVEILQARSRKRQKKQSTFRLSKSKGAEIDFVVKEAEIRVQPDRYDFPYIGEFVTQLRQPPIQLDGIRPLDNSKEEILYERPLSAIKSDHFMEHQDSMDLSYPVNIEDLSKDRRGNRARIARRKSSRHSMMKDNEPENLV